MPSDLWDYAPSGSRQTWSPELSTTCISEASKRLDLIMGGEGRAHKNSAVTWPNCYLSDSRLTRAEMDMCMARDLDNLRLLPSQKQTFSQARRATLGNLNKTFSNYLIDNYKKAMRLMKDTRVKTAPIRIWWMLMENELKRITHLPMCLLESYYSAVWMDSSMKNVSLLSLLDM